MHFILVVPALASLVFAVPQNPEVNYWFSLWVSFFTSRLVFLTRYLSPSGDSYTQTGFEVNGTQPSIGNPLGNPPYPVRVRPLMIRRLRANARLGSHGSQWTKLDRY